MINTLRKITPRFIKNFYHKTLALLASFIYGFPSRKIKIIAITGTDGKTTTCYLTTSILETAGYKVAELSGIRFKIGDKEWPNKTDNTTPGRFKLRKFISRAVKNKCDYLVLEVTSWALAQYRVKNVSIDIALLTNLTLEHLDLHKTMAEYRQAKGRLFEMLSTGYYLENVPKISIVNLDDNDAQYFLSFKADQKITYGIETATDISAENVKPGADKIDFDLLLNEQSVRVSFKLPGLYNVYNALAAAAVGSALKINSEKIKQGIEKIEYVPGRMERIDAGQDFTVVVDFAHTPNGLKELFKAARTMIEPGKKIIAVYGSAGGRDKEKRPLIGEVAGQLVDFSFLTTDDPRNEDPLKIAQTIEIGLKKTGKVLGKDYTFVIDRAEAIAEAVRMARPGDIVLLCSMGCYQCMYVGDGKITWDDRLEARKALEKFQMSKSK
ncbi:MAG TPA: UDP-N-acetylmuramoyl-L-alanyl-D-glutamate--2,6-diaminopimelate ligase [Patescibacteria group bacterium]